MTVGSALGIVFTLGTSGALATLLVLMFLGYL